MPSSPKIAFTLVVTSDDPDLRLAGSIASEEAPREALIEDVIIKTIHNGNTWSGELPSGDYAYSFDLSKKGKIKIAAVTPADPEPAAEPFEAKTNEERFNRVFTFEVRGKR